MQASATSPDAAPVNTGKVTGRRELHFEHIDEVYADAERLVAAAPQGQGIQMLGNWSLGKVLAHLGQAIEVSIDNEKTVTPLPVRWMLRTFLLKRMLTKGMPSGFQLPKAQAEVFVPKDEPSPQEGLERLKQAIHRYHSEPRKGIHPAFGQLTPAQLDQLHCRHGELHLSFAVLR